MWDRARLGRARNERRRYGLCFVPHQLLSPGASSEGKTKVWTPRLMGKLSPPPKVTLLQVFKDIQKPHGLLAAPLALYCLPGSSAHASPALQSAPSPCFCTSYPHTYNLFKWLFSAHPFTCSQACKPPQVAYVQWLLPSAVPPHTIIPSSFLGCTWYTCLPTLTCGLLVLCLGHPSPIAVACGRSTFSSTPFCSTTKMTNNVFFFLKTQNTKSE